ncbi:hypothetical protein DMUE_1224 [Dictyocoela muelleri]|nr:hypothetical protein DMUE_1224 [Dictyocoela muelleri]
MLFINLSFIFSVKIKNNGSILTLGSSADYELKGPKNDKYALKTNNGTFIKVNNDKIGFTRKPTYYLPIEKNGKYQLKNDNNKCWERTAKGIILKPCMAKESQLFEFEGDCDICKSGKLNSSGEKDKSGTIKGENDKSGSVEGSKPGSIDISGSKSGSIGINSSKSGSIDLSGSKSGTIDINSSKSGTISVNNDKKRSISKSESESESSSSSDSDSKSVKNNELKKMVKDALVKNNEKSISGSGSSSSSGSGSGSKNAEINKEKENVIKANIISNQTNIRLNRKDLTKPEYLESTTTTESESKIKNQYVKGLHDHTSLHKKIYSSPYYYNGNTNNDIDNSEYNKKVSKYYSDIQKYYTDQSKQYYEKYYNSSKNISKEGDNKCKKKVYTTEEEIVSY